MKWFTQFVLPLGLLAGIVGGVVYFKHFTRTPPRPVRIAPPVAPSGGEVIADPLHFEEHVYLAEPDYPQYAGEFEVREENHADSWFVQRQTVPIEIGLFRKGCTCSHVELGIPAVDPSKLWRGDLPAITALNLLSFAGPDIVGIARWQQVAEQMKWTKLEKNDLFEVVMPAAGGMPLLGVARLNFTGKEASAKRLTAILMARPQGSPGRADIPLEVPVQFVVPLRVMQGTIDIGELSPVNPQRTAEMVVWSATHRDLPVRVEPVAENDPCVEIGKLRKLDAVECLTLQRRLSEQEEGRVPVMSRVRSAWAVPITLHERASGKQLDLGPVVRRVRFHYDGNTDDMPYAAITGTVRGELRIGMGSDRDQINLGKFSAASGTSLTVTLTSLQAGLKLELDGVQPAEIASGVKATLSDPEVRTGQTHWKVRVTVEPRTLSGKLPGSSAVVLRIVGTTRKLRVPIVGTAEGR